MNENISSSSDSPTEEIVKTEEKFEYDKGLVDDQVRRMVHAGIMHNQESEENIRESKKLLLHPPSTTHTKRVLIAEDSLPVTKLISSSLVRHGFETVVVSNGLEAVRAVKKPSKSMSSEISTVVDGEPDVMPYDLEHFDAILMDLQMPVMTGLDAVREIRELEKKQSRSSNKNYFIVVISAGTNPEEINKAYESGANHFLPKPFEMKTFLKVLNDKMENF